jgi:hypothetical protein
MNLKNVCLKYEEHIAYSDNVRAMSLMDYTAVPGGSMNHKYRGADKFLARPGKKQATAIEDFDFHISNL